MTTGRSGKPVEGEQMTPPTLGWGGDHICQRGKQFVSQRGNGASARGGDDAAMEDDIYPAEGYLAPYGPTQVDLRMQSVYGYWVHVNYGSQITGGVADDHQWQAYWKEIAFLPSLRYGAPGIKVGRRFVCAMAMELAIVRTHHWNSKRFIVFLTVILQCAHHILEAQAIRKNLL